MANISLNARIDGTIRLDLNFEEAAALDAISGYGSKAFLKVFYEHLGRAYLEPHERALISLFEKIHGSSGIPTFLNRVREANEVFLGLKIARYPEPKTKMTAKDYIEK